MVSYPVVFDTNPADIQPVAAAAAAGGNGKMADSGHAHLGMSQLATTPAAGVALVNATQNIVTWTAPNDGALHRVQVMANQDVTSLETGGLVVVTYTLPDGQAVTQTAFASGQAAGQHTFTNTYFVKANTAITLGQTTALSGGAAVVWADLWGY